MLIAKRRGCQILSNIKLGQPKFVRYLTSHEVSTALRPFYFLVHPDLFGKHPEAQEQNERSLKTLKNYVDSLVVDRKQPNPKNVTFFIKPRTAEEKEKTILKSVKISLKESNIRATVTTILRQVSLPTGYVDKLPPEKESDVHTVEDLFKYEDDEVGNETGFGFSATDTRQPFPVWLSNNIDKARSRFAECEPIRLETERIQGEVCYNFQLKDIIWDCGWDTLNRRGAIEAFNYLATQHAHIQGRLIGRTLLFGRKSGITVKGDIILYSGDVRTNWLNIINNAEKSDNLLKFLPLYERAVSQSLLGIKLTQSSVDTTLIEEYRVRLRKVVTTISDFKRRNKFPEFWGSDLSDLEMCVESDACSLMMNPRGVLMIPASTPAFLIVQFISDSLETAKQRKMEYSSLIQEETRLITNCMNELGLIQLDKEDSITAAEMIHCCRAMLDRVKRLRHLTHGSHIIVTSYYMVKSDGIICVPWDLKFGDEKETKGQNDLTERLALC